MGQWSEQGSPGQGGRSRGRTEPSDSSPRSDSSLEVIKMSWIKRNKRSQQNFSHMSCHEFLNLVTCIRLRHSWQISLSRYYLPWDESSCTKPGKNFSKVRIRLQSESRKQELRVLPLPPKSLEDLLLAPKASKASWGLSIFSRGSKWLLLCVRKRLL